MFDTASGETVKNAVFPAINCEERKDNIRREAGEGKLTGFYLSAFLLRRESHNESDV